MAKHDVTIEPDGTVLIDGHAAALISEHEAGYTSVMARIGSDCVELARFRNYKPSDTAREWAQHVLAAKTPRQVLNLLKSHSAVQIGKRLGWTSPAARDALVLPPLRYPRTGAPPKKIR